MDEDAESHGISWSPRPQYLLHLLPSRQLVDQFVEVADLAHDRVFDLLDADAADQALDQRPVGVGARGLCDEALDVGLVCQDGGEVVRAVARQPEDDLVDSALVRPFFSAFAT
jgi:hypothetical protein